MKISPLPENEKERLEAIRSYHILDTEDELDFNGIVELASQLCDAPISLITLIDERRQWFKAKTGLDIKETHRNLSFCAHAIHKNDVMVVCDTLQDERFFDNPLVTGDPYIRFYAGMPLITKEGYKLGTLAVIDRVPRNLNEQQLKSLRILGKQVVSLLNQRSQVQEKMAEIRDIFERISDAFVAVDKNWRVAYINEKAAQITNRLPKDVLGKNLWNEFPEALASDFSKLAEAALATQKPQYQEAYFPPYNLWLEAHIYPSPIGLSIYFRDITERKKVEEAIKGSEEKRTLIMDSALDAIICMNTASVITFWNRQAEKIFGWKETEIIGKNLTDTIIPIQYRDHHKKGLKHYLKTEEGPILNRIIEISALNREGKEFPVELTIVPMKQNGSEFFCAFIRDITERKKMEAELRESEANYRKLIEGTPQPMWVYDLENLDVLEVNEAAILKYGYSREEFLKMNLIDLRPRGEVDKLLGFFKTGQIATKGLTQSGPWKHRLKNGELIDVEVTSHEISWNGRRARFALAWDVTKRLQIEESIRKAEEQYRSIFENAQEGIYQSTPDGKFITVNPSLAIMFGYSSAEELIASVFDIGAQLYANPQDRLYMKNLLQKEGKAYGVEFTGLKKNKEIISLRNHVRAIYDNEGNIKYFEGTIDDITERKMTEEKLKIQFAELQKTNYELDRFVYSVSHDLRAPLASILGLINVAEMENPSPAFKNYLALIRNSINRMDGFIKDILDYSRNSRMDVRIEKINFRDLITETQNNLKLMSGAQRLKITAQIKDNVAFYADSTRIGILLSNLFSNSIKYQDFRKEASFLHLSIVTSSKKATIIVKDNGIGISEKHVTKIFDMFYRASENSKGSGLGLYIAKETITKLGGTIKVQSEFGISTTFEITIPNSTPN